MKKLNEKQKRIEGDKKMEMTNVTIEQMKETYYIVRATTNCFGENEIMYEGTSLEDCLEYIAKHEALGYLDFESILTKSEVAYLVYRYAKKVADKKGCSVTSISKITGCGSDTNIFEVVEKAVKHNTYKWLANKKYRQIVAGLRTLLMQLN